MSRVLCLGLWFCVSLAARADGDSALGLGRADLERLGVAFERPTTVSGIEIASGPAEVVIPPAQQAIVSTMVDGVLTRALVAEGDLVAAGQPMAEIASADLLRLEREFLDASSAAALARAQLQRDRGLHSDGIIAERRLQETGVAERTAATFLEHARQQLALVGLTDAELARLVDTGRLASTLELRAPFSAVVVEQLSALGAHVDALDPVYRVADLSRLWIEVHVPQESAERIAPGMRIVGTVGDRTRDAEVTHVSRVVDATSQSVLVRGSVDNADLALRAGQYLHARVLEGRREGFDAFSVPSAAIVRVDGDAHVFVRRGEQTNAEAVEILAEDGTDTYIRAVFDADVEVAVEGVATLKSVWLSGTAKEN